MEIKLPDNFTERRCLEGYIKSSEKVTPLPVNAMV